jgi:hypothetical protein
MLAVAQLLVGPPMPDRLKGRRWTKRATLVLQVEKNSHQLQNRTCSINSTNYANSSPSQRLMGQERQDVTELSRSATSNRNGGGGGNCFSTSHISPEVTTYPMLAEVCSKSSSSPSP